MTNIICKINLKPVHDHSYLKKIEYLECLWCIQGFKTFIYVSLTMMHMGLSPVMPTIDKLMICHATTGYNFSYIEPISKIQKDIFCGRIVVILLIKFVSTVIGFISEI